MRKIAGYLTKNRSEKGQKIAQSTHENGYIKPRKTFWRNSKQLLNYLNRFWKEIFAYLDDGELPIDNNLAERTIRKLTTQRNNSLHYGSDAGAEMAATYHSVIGTVKLHGTSVWNFIGKQSKKGY